MVQRAKAIYETAQTIIESGKLELQFIDLVGRARTRSSLNSRSRCSLLRHARRLQQLFELTLPALGRLG
jgi:hypothetical protein